MSTYATIDEYIESFSEEKQKPLEQIREIIKKLCPDAVEVISYGMPAFRYHGLLVWFAVHTNHIGFYPRASAIAAFKKELSPYKSAKGSVQFPLNQILPVLLIQEMVKFRIIENLAKSKKKKRK